MGFAVKYSIFPRVLEDLIYKNLDLTEGTEAYEGWVEPPVPVYMSFRLFNVTNPEDIKKGQKPSVQELGPYVYREVRRKENILEVDRDKLNYGLYMEYHFDGEQTFNKEQFSLSFIRYHFIMSQCFVLFIFQCPLLDKNHSLK